MTAACQNITQRDLEQMLLAIVADSADWRLLTPYVCDLLAAKSILDRLSLLPVAEGSLSRRLPR